ncbi:MAG: efflux transporter outer membrane subunit [Bacteroidales bacterium]|nr:efflux transporter outer membrane subunit [Bacteroidales bacterium]
MKSTKYLLIATLLLGLSSCGIYKKYEMPIENQYVNRLAESEAKADSTTLPYITWERVFTDPILQDYIRTALAENKDIDNAALNVQMAQAQLQGAKLSYFPAVTLSPNGGAAKYGSGRMDTWTYQIPLSIQWEIDVFGKILNRKRSAKVSLEQMEDYQQATRSQIISAVANTYYGLVLLHQQLDLTQRTSQLWKDQVESMKLMKEAAYVNEAAVVQSAANYWSIMSSIPDIRQSIHELNGTMSLLLHTDEKEWKVSGDMSFDLPAEFTSGVPVSYLAARPDVRAAERGLAAAYYSVSSARAAFYPSLMISSNGGFTNLLGSLVTNPGKWFIQLAGQLTAPLFARGQNIANLKVAKARQQQAMNEFENTVLAAAVDVSDALSLYRNTSEKREALLQQIDNLEKSVEYTQELLTLDQSTTYLEVLTSRASLLNAQMSALNCWHSKVQALINLYQAVGGGR